MGHGLTMAMLKNQRVYIYGGKTMMDDFFGKIMMDDPKMDFQNNPP